MYKDYVLINIFQNINFYLLIKYDFSITYSSNQEKINTTLKLLYY